MGFQISQSGKVRTASEPELERWREEFRRLHCVKLSALLAPEFLRMVLNELGRSSFHQRSHEGISEELCIDEGALVGRVLNLALNNSALMDFVEQLVGCRIGHFGGRVYRMAPGSGHYDSWHDDWSNHRVAALSLNLSTEPYEGGGLKIREAGSGRLVGEFPNRSLGDALLFRLDPGLEHFVAPLEGTVAKTAFAGWFCSEPDYRDILRTQGNLALKS